MQIDLEKEVNSTNKSICASLKHYLSFLRTDLRSTSKTKNQRMRFVKETYMCNNIVEMYEEPRKYEPIKWWKVIDLNFQMFFSSC